MRITNPETGGGDNLDLWRAYLTLSTYQNANLSSNEHVQWDTINKSGDFDTYEEDLTTPITWAGSQAPGQDLGIVELKSGKTYHLRSILRVRHTAADSQILCKWYDLTNAVILGQAGLGLSANSTNDEGYADCAEAIVTPSTDIKVCLYYPSYTNPHRRLRRNK